MTCHNTLGRGETLLGVCGDIAARMDEALAEGTGSFEEVAATAIGSTGACGRIARLDIFGELAGAQLPDAVPLENDFAYPTITVLRAKAFRIELLFWRRGSEAYVHDHLAGGAFAIVRGTRVHASFSFIDHKDRGNGIVTGGLRLDRAEVCRPGYVCAIPPMDGLIHSLYYLDEAAITLSIRQICEINARETGAATMAYRPHEGHYLVRLKLRTGMGIAAKKLAALLESARLAGLDDARFSDFVQSLVRTRSAAQMIATASSETFALDGSAVEAVIAAVVTHHPDLEGYADESLRWFSDKARVALVADHLDEQERLISWLVLMGADGMVVERVLVDAFGLNTEMARSKLVETTHRLLHQRLDDGFGEVPLVRCWTTVDWLLSILKRAGGTYPQ